MKSLVQTLVDGPIDIIGDVHGDLQALKKLLRHLGYDAEGKHPEHRRLVFVGDLTDRGPDSPAVINLVQQQVDSGFAQCVLGNHELNILLNRQKFDNGWFFGQEFVDPATGEIVSQQLANDQVRGEIIDFFRRLPLVLRRNDIRIVHACWQAEMVSMATEANDVLEFHEQHQMSINLGLAIRSDLQEWQRQQRLQNLNPVKVLTSGLEVQAETTYQAGGKLRNLQRYPWWKDYTDNEYCFFGHYSLPYGEPRCRTRAICIDFGVAKRWVPNKPDDRSPDKWRLAAVRYPEMQFVFDDGDTRQIVV